MSNRNVKGADAKAPTVVITKAQRDDINKLTRLVMQAEDTETKARIAVANYYEAMGEHIKTTMGVSLHTFIGMTDDNPKEKCIIVSGEPMTVHQLCTFILDGLADAKLPRTKSDYPVKVDASGKVIRDAKGKVALDNEKPKKKTKLSRLDLYRLSKAEAKQLSDVDKRRRELAGITVRTYWQRLLRAIRSILVQSGQIEAGTGSTGKRTAEQKIETLCRSIINLMKSEDCTFPESVKESNISAAFAMAKRTNSKFTIEKK